jgi:hypothetical protein
VSVSPRQYEPVFVASANVTVSIQGQSCPSGSFPNYDVCTTPVLVRDLPVTLTSNVTSAFAEFTRASEITANTAYIELMANLTFKLSGANCVLRANRNNPNKMFPDFDEDFSSSNNITMRIPTPSRSSVRV